MEHYNLPKLPYDYKDLQPYISAEVLTLHHDKHHAAYVAAANMLLDKIADARNNKIEIDYKSIDLFPFRGRFHSVIFTVLGFRAVSCNTMVTTITTPSMAKFFPRFPASTVFPKNPVMTAPEAIPTRFINP